VRGVLVFVLLALGATEPAVAADFTFGVAQRLTLARNYERSVAIGDVNGDGRMDLAATEDLTYEVHDVSVFLQRADGSLAPSVTSMLPVEWGSMYPVAFADLDGDGAAEMLIGTSHLIVVRLVGGVLVADDAPPAKYSCAYLATGDIDSDGKTDVLCHSGLGTPTAATIYYGDGRGGFRETAVLQTDVGSYGYTADFMSVRLADVTGDARPDLLVTASRIGMFYVYANDGRGGFFSTATPYAHPWSPSGVWPAALEVVDIDGDGTNEVVTATPDDRPDARLNIYRRGPNGLLVLGSRIPIYDSTTALLAADLDADGHADFVAGHYGFNAISVVDAYAGGGIDSQPLFELPGFGIGLQVTPGSGTSKALAFGDLNGDGCADLAAATYSGVFVMYGCRTPGRSVPVGDFDGDGVSDLLWRNDVTAELYDWRWADIQGWYDCALPCPVHKAPPWMPGPTGDFDGDGNTDTFWRNQEDGSNAFLAGALYNRPIDSVTNLDWQVVATGDFDGDDRSDLFWRNRSSGANAMWEGADGARRLNLRTVGDPNWRVAGAGDFDGDGRSDILWRHAVSGQTEIWFLSGERDTRRVLPMVNLQWQVQGVGDFNGDGRADVFWRNLVSGSNVLWLSGDSNKQRLLMDVPNLDWNVGAVGDYNGDGRSDLAWRNRRSGDNVIWESADAGYQEILARMDTAITLLP
jgi:hypothetical protein